MDEQQYNEQQGALATQSPLTILLTSLKTALHNYSDSQMLDIFSFCLYHLFTHLNDLFHTSLPILHYLPLQSLSLVDSYQAWTSLHHLQQTLRRLHSLSCLLNGTIPALLPSLDIPLSHKRNSRQNKHAPEEALLQEAQMLLTTLVSAWPSPSDNHTPSVMTSLGNIWQHLYQPAHLLFGQLLPQSELTADHETLAILLLDIAQRNDQLQLATEELLARVHTLIAQHALYSDGLILTSKGNS